MPFEDEERRLNPVSPGGRSIESNALTIKQYFLVNLSRFIIELGGTAVLSITLSAMNNR